MLVDLPLDRARYRRGLAALFCWALAMGGLARPARASLATATATAVAGVEKPVTDSKTDSGATGADADAGITDPQAGGSGVATASVDLAILHGLSDDYVPQLHAGASGVSA